MRHFLAQRGAVLTPRSTSVATALHGKVGVGEHREVALPRSNAAMGNGTVLRRGRMRRAAKAAVRTSLPVDWQDRGRWHPATSLAGQFVIRSQRDATTSCTVLMAATRGTAPCASQGPFIVTVTGQYVCFASVSFSKDLQNETLVISFAWRGQSLTAVHRFSLLLA